MMLFDVAKRSGRSLRQAKARTLLTSAAIGVGAFALTLTLAASNGAQDFVNKIISNNFDPAELIVAKDNSLLSGPNASSPQQYDPSFGQSLNNAGAVVKIKRLDDNDIARLKTVDGVESVRKAVSVNVQYITRPAYDGHTFKKYVASVEIFSNAQHPDLAAGTIIRPLAPKTIILSDSYLKLFGFKTAQEAIGQQVTLVVQRAFDQPSIASLLSGGVDSAAAASAERPSQSTKFTVAAVALKPITAQPGTEFTLYINETDATELSDFASKGTDNFHKYTFAYVRVKGGADKTLLAATSKRLQKLGYGTQSVQDTQKFLNQIISVLRGIVVAFGLIAVIASVFGIVNTMYISVLQRTREIGLMKALGMRKRDISRLFRIEAAFIGLLGGLLGSLLAFLLGTGLNPTISKQLNLGAGSKLLIFKPSQIGILIIILIVVAIIAGLLPARKAARLDPIEALRTE